MVKIIKGGGAGGRDKYVFGAAKDKKKNEEKKKELEREFIKQEQLKKQREQIEKKKTTKAEPKKEVIQLGKPKKPPIRMVGEPKTVKEDITAPGGYHTGKYGGKYYIENKEVSAEEYREYRSKDDDVIRLGGENVIRLGGEKKEDKGWASISEQLKRQKEIENPLLKAITSPITTAALATTLAVAGAGALILSAGVGTATAESATVIAAGKWGTAITAKKAVLSAGVLGKMGVSTKTLGLLSGWAVAVWWGKWGQAEAVEGLNIVMRDTLKEAQKTGNYDLYWEASAARDEISDLALWEKIALWSPLAPFIGIPNKMKGVAASAKVMDKLAREMQSGETSGESDDDKWERIRQEQEDSKEGMIDYYNDERKKMVEWEREAEEDARDDDAKFWKEERKKTAQSEKEAMEANAKFWEDYKKLTIQMEQKAAEETADFWLDYAKKKQAVEVGTAEKTADVWKQYQAEKGEEEPSAPKTTRTYHAPSALGFGLLKGGGYYTEEEEEKKKKKK